MGKFDPPRSHSTAIGGTLTFDFYEGGQGRVIADTSLHHCLIIPVDDTPLSISKIRGGVAQPSILNKGDIALVPQGAETQWEWIDSTKVILIRLDPNALVRFIEHEMRLMLTGNCFENEAIITNSDLSATACQLHKASLQRDAGANIMFDALARVFLVTLVRRFTTYDTHGPVGFGLEEYTVILDFIESHLDSKITPATLAHLVGMSEASFGRKFKQRVGQSPMTFVKQARLRAALVHLHEGRISLGEIALLTGFSDQAHFSRVFRTAHGKTPGKYRSSLRT
ncbi:MAG: AraC family transcriptional regulator [Litoreibacter sp.]